MGKIISNGINYSGLINAEGVFIDTDIILDSGTYQSTFSYTATKDCYMYALLVTKQNDVSTASINGEYIANVYSATSGAIQKDVLVPLKKGQIFSVANSESWTCNYTVYGIQQGSTSGLIDYSTNEQYTGQHWIDGKPIYQKTFNLSSSVVTTANSWSIISGVTLSGDEDVILKTEVYLNADKSMKVGFGKNDNGTFKYFDTVQLSIDKVTIQYTKSST